MSKFRVIIFIEEYSDVLRDKILHLLSNKNPEEVEFWSNKGELDKQLSLKGYEFDYCLNEENLNVMIVENRILSPKSFWNSNYVKLKHLKTRIIKNGI